MTICSRESRAPANSSRQTLIPSVTALAISSQPQIKTGEIVKKDLLHYQAKLGNIKTRTKRINPDCELTSLPQFNPAFRSWQVKNSLRDTSKLMG
jgi:hypothetical protein